jgi:hypothetical protein
MVIRAMRAATTLLLGVQLCACVDLAAVQAEAEGAAFKGGRRGGAVTLAPWQQISAARLAPRVNDTGVPLPGPGAAPLMPFIRPSAVALRGGDLYVVDSGANAVFHVAIGTEMMNAIAGAPAQMGVRVYETSDRSLYLADPVLRRVTRYTPGGRVQQVVAAPVQILPRPGALAVDERRGLIIVADVSLNQLVVLPLLGGSAYPVVPRGPGGQLAKLESVATGADGFYATDLLCRCVTLFAPNGTVIAVFGQETLLRPGPIGVDSNERVFVVDRGDNTIKVFSGGRQIASFTGNQLGVLEIADLAVDEGALAVADGVGAKVVLVRVLVAPPVQAEEK